MNVGLCVYGLPDLFTSFFSDSVIKWVQIIVESDGKIGDVGTGMGRVEFSICKTIDEEPTQPSEQEGYEVREPVKNKKNKKCGKFPTWGGGSGPGHFPHFQKLKKI